MTALANGSMLNTHKTHNVLQPAFLHIQLRFQSLAFCQQVSTLPFHDFSAKMSVVSVEVVQGWVVGIANESYVLPEVI